jgi:1,4-dihydroxy-2-naphthoyl-CoA hydrolase
VAIAHVEVESRTPDDPGDTPERTFLDVNAITVISQDQSNPIVSHTQGSAAREIKRAGQERASRPCAGGPTVTRKRITAEMPVTAKHMNRSGRVNGGALMAFADALGATGTVANLPAGHRTTTLESKTNFFAAGAAPMLKAVSKPLHIGRTTMVWQTTIRNADRRLVAVVTQTQMVLPVAR